MAVQLEGVVQFTADSIAGFNTGNVDDELSYQGSGSVGGKAGSGITRYFHTGTARNFNAGGQNEGDHVVAIIGSLTPGKLQSKVNGGIRASWGNSTTVYNEKYVDGADTKPTTTLFLPYIYDPASAVDNSAGAVDLSAVNTFGFTASALSGIMGNFNNFLGDQCTIGKGLRGTGVGGSLTEWIAADEGTTSNRWGFLTTREGIVYFQGKMFFGGPGVDYTFSDSDKVIIFPDVSVAVDFFEITVDGVGSDVTFDGFTVQAAGVRKVALVHRDGTWAILNSTIDGARVIAGGAGMTVDSCKLSNSGTFTQNQTTILSTSFINGTSPVALTMDDSASVSGLVFTGNNTAIDATDAIVDNAVNLDNIRFTGNTTDVIVNSPDTITIRNLNGSNATTAINTGAGGVIIESLASVTFTFSQDPTGGELRIYEDDGDGNEITIGTEREGVEVLTQTQYTFLHSALEAGVKIFLQFMHPGVYEEEVIPVTLSASDQTVNIILTTEEN